MMAAEWVQTTTAILGAVGALTGVGAVISAFTQRKKARADAADVITDSALTLLEPLKARVTELELEVRDLRTSLTRLRVAIFTPSATVEQLREMAGDWPAPRNGKH